MLQRLTTDRMATLLLTELMLQLQFNVKLASIIIV